MRIGFVVNPIAGMGGSVGLRGTDGDALEEAIKRGAKPVAPRIAQRFIDALAQLCPSPCRELSFVTAPGIMGEDYLRHRGFTYVTVPHAISSKTSARDTIVCTSMMLDIGVDVVVFVGGDGTARDVASVVDLRVPVLGVPAGVKMYSGVFAVSPEAAAKILYDASLGHAEVIEAEIADIDEEAFRQDRLAVKLYTIVKTLKSGNLLAPQKDVVLGDEEAKKAIAKYFTEELIDNETLYILGPGSTVKAIADAIGVPKTLLGVDAIVGRKVLGLDLWGSQLLDLVKRFNKRKLVLTPIGGQGFLIGRGNKQLTPEILKYFTKGDLIVVATPSKISKLQYLIVDTGDPELDKRFAGYHRVITGYREEVVIKIVPASAVEDLT